MPSRVEGMPLRLLEGWASKLPVVLTKTGDNDLYVIDGKNGFLAESSIEGIKNALEKVINSKSLEKITENGYKDVQKYTWKNIAEKTYEEYKKLIK